MRGQTVRAVVDLASHQIDHLTGFAHHAAFGVLKCQIGGQCSFGVSESGIQIGNHAQSLFEVVKNCLVGWINFFAGGNVDCGHGEFLVLVKNGKENLNGPQLDNVGSNSRELLKLMRGKGGIANLAFFSGSLI